MGAKEVNFHRDVFARMGYEQEAVLVQDLFLEGRRDEAVAAVPRQLAADISLVGTRERIRDELALWEAAGVTMLVIGATTVAELRTIADAVLG
jgi:alkanesulfonate monooxygenase SsuD/methylene tetrahydromethanopterin reductase-like flavin-dependent oxidoreductase (luciferase family)